MDVFNCIGNGKARIVAADTAEDAEAICMERYEYFPETVIKLVKSEPE